MGVNRAARRESRCAGIRPSVPVDWAGTAGTGTLGARNETAAPDPRSEGMGYETGRTWLPTRCRRMRQPPDAGLWNAGPMFVYVIASETLICCAPVALTPP